MKLEIISLGLIVTQTQTGLALISLYRALGGGWDPDDAIAASVSP